MTGRARAPADPGDNAARANAVGTDAAATDPAPRAGTAASRARRPTRPSRAVGPVHGVRTGPSPLKGPN
jgi:hypothetical protein